MARKRLGTLNDLRRYLADVLNRLDSKLIEAAEAKTRAYIVHVLSGIIKDADVEERLAELERKMAKVP